MSIGQQNHKSFNLKKDLKKTIILIHGFVGSPYDFKPIAQPLANQGFRVVIPIMPGQTSNDDLLYRSRYTPSFYLNFFKDIVEKERTKTGGKPYLIGFSMGGAISTLLAAEGIIDKLALISPFYSLTIRHDQLTKLSNLIKNIIPAFPKFVKGKINYPLGKKQYQPGSYWVSTGAYYQLSLLGQFASTNVSRIQIPTIIFASPNDEVASFKKTKELYKNHSTATLYEYPNSNHILLFDYDSEKIISKIINFFTSD